MKETRIYVGAGELLIINYGAHAQCFEAIFAYDLIIRLQITGSLLHFPSQNYSICV